MKELSDNEAWRIVKSIVARLPTVKLTSVTEPCVIMHLASSILEKVNINEHSQLLAWFPERQFVAVVADRLLPYREYVHVASYGGMLCGLSRHNYYNDDYPPDDTLRLAVVNPTTGLKMKLPFLRLGTDFSAFLGEAHRTGNLRIKMQAAGDDQFRVYILLYQGGGPYTVYTYDSGSGAWVESSTPGHDLKDDFVRDDRLVGDLVFRLKNLHSYDVETRRWTSISCPGKAWNDYPIPKKLRGCRYRTLYPFWYGSRFLMAGVCNKKYAVVLEDDDRGSSPGNWRVVSWTQCQNSETTYDIPGPYFEGQVPRVCGKLLVFASHDFPKPTAFHLEDRTWLELPRPAMELPLQMTCIYNPS